MPDLMGEMQQIYFSLLQWGAFNTPSNLKTDWDKYTVEMEGGEIEIMWYIVVGPK